MTDRAETRQAIVDLMNDFAHALDTQDWEGLANLLSPDLSYGARNVAKGTEGAFFVELDGPEKMIGLVRGTVSRLSATHHILGNHRVDLAGDAATATASCYMRAHHAGKGDKAGLFQESLGRYDFEATLVDGRWRFARIVQNIFTTQGTNDVFG